MSEKLENQIAFMKKNGYPLSYTEYENIYMRIRNLSIYMYRSQRRLTSARCTSTITLGYSVKQFGLIQVKDIKNNNDYAIRV